MSTRSSIAIKHGSVVKAVYCHWDGYVRYVGRLLNAHYQSSPKVNNLIAQGDISSLGVEIGDEHDFDYREPYDKDGFSPECTFYARDRGENTPFSTHLSELEWISEFTSCDYFYLYDSGVWYVSEGGANDFVPLHEAVECVRLREEAE